MTAVYKVVGLIFSLFLLLSVQPAYAEERSFEIGEVEIHARVDSEGSMHVIETDTYHFDGAFNGIIVNLNPSDSDGIENFQAFEVAEQDTIPLEFEQSANGDMLAYRVYSKSENETKVFQLTYSFKNVVQVHADTAELYWKFFDKSNPSALGTVRIDVTLPGEPEQEEITAFGHGPLHGNVNIGNGGVVRYEVSPLPSEEMLEVRILFPGATVPGSTKINADAKREQILEEERNWTAGSEADEEASVYGALALLIANLAAGTLIFAKFGKKFKPEWSGKYYRELPGDVTPAVVSYLMNYRIEPRDLIATLVDLVRKKHVAMETVKQPAKGRKQSDYTFRLINKETDGLLPHETMLIDWFFGELGDGDEVSLSNIRQHSARKADAKAFLKRWSEWQAEIVKAVEPLNYIESQKKMSTLVILAVIAQFFGILFLAPEAWKWLMFCAIPLLFFKPKSKRRTRIGQTAYTKWKAFRRFLRDYSQIASREPLAVHLWEHYFVYAITLGEARRMNDITRVKLPIANDDHTITDTSAFFHYHYWTESFEKTISAANKTANPSSDSSGGSFSSGGGGGGGGGGRGAF